ncbi:response regulator transcription factor [Scleromatobacter humisilvae]|uniref:Response regulator transcription factor n=1 Tax=Scleromatobacter humisilvae TaxID=2897159 RepID=A0A9X2C0A2_9BURK|nr:response regulator transcription factor [Scleromatobacter humisilvae]MCK9687137.1 response regulator transcription factor [Scleromatobacter humisilvae]
MSNRPIQVFVVHDDYVCRTGLTAAFAECDDMRVQATSQDDPALLSCDVVVTDFDNGIRILAAMHALQLDRAGTKVAIVANAEREWQIRDALKRGAAGFLPLGSSAEELYVAVRTVHRGECHLSPSIAARLATSLATEPLTEREGQVLALLTDGLCNKHIASRLDISVGTVKAHLRSAFDKLGVHSRTEAILIAERRGMLRQPGPARRPPALAQVQAPPVLPRPRIHHGNPFVDADVARFAPADA